ncbi:MAG: hypothetical protein ABH954_03630 [Candidatus Omnitrophota bacterium]
MKKLVILTLFLVLSSTLAGICLAEVETRPPITTYYPSPLGVYQTIQLYPHHDAMTCDNINLDNEGIIFYCDDPVQCGLEFSEAGLYYCGKNTADDLKWQIVGSGGGGNWTLVDAPAANPETHYLYPKNLDELISPHWHVGIGTATPLTLLHVEDGGLVVRCEGDLAACAGIGPTPVAGAGTRLMFIPEKAAFRSGGVGGVDGTQWNDANIGDYSFALGFNTIASGSNSIALGLGTTATSNHSLALGNNTTSSGDYGVAMGQGTLATGSNALAMGISTDTAQWYANSGYTMGRDNRAEGYCWAAGNNTIACDPGFELSIAWGYDAKAYRQRRMAVGLDGTYCEADATEPYTFKICGDLHVDDTLGTTHGNIEARDVVYTTALNTITSSKFKIPHPDPNKPEGTFLKHSTVEAPTVGENLYRWTVDVINGEAKIRLPDYYEYLNKNDMVWVAPVDNFGRGYGEVDEKQKSLTIKADLDGKYNVVLIGTRKDEHASRNWQGPEVYSEPKD